MVERIGYEYVAIAVKGDSRRTIHLTIGISVLSPLANYFAFNGDVGYLVGCFIGHPEIFIAIHDQRSGPDEVAIRTGGASHLTAAANQVDRSEIVVVVCEPSDESELITAAQDM